jgi:hypothetical protein
LDLTYTKFIRLTLLPTGGNGKIKGQDWVFLQGPKGFQEHLRLVHGIAPAEPRGRRPRGWAFVIGICNYRRAEARDTEPSHPLFARERVAVQSRSEAEANGTFLTAPAALQQNQDVEAAPPPTGAQAVIAAAATQQQQQQQHAGVSTRSSFASAAGASTNTPASPASPATNRAGRRTTAAKRPRQTTIPVREDDGGYGPEDWADLQDEEEEEEGGEPVSKLTKLERVFAWGRKRAARVVERGRPAAAMLGDGQLSYLELAMHAYEADGGDAAAEQSAELAVEQEREQVEGQGEAVVEEGQGQVSEATIDPRLLMLD